MNFENLQAYICLHYLDADLIDLPLRGSEGPHSAELPGAKVIDLHLPGLQ